MTPHRELAHEAWDEYFTSLSKELLNAPISIEICSPTRPSTIEARRLALQALSYDRRDDVFEVSAARGGPRLPSSLRHLVDHPAHVYVDSDTMLAPMTIAVDGSDGVRTLIRVERDGAFEG
jgi:Family of unknown function (DUF5335)